MFSRLFAARLTAAEVLAIIARFVSNTPAHPREWDDFLRSPIASRRLEQIRQTCLALPERYPPVGDAYCGEEGIRVLREIITELRTR